MLLCITERTNVAVHRAAANDMSFRICTARGSVCNALLCPLPLFLHYLWQEAFYTGQLGAVVVDIRWSIKSDCKRNI